jgi:hypothetical protein
MALSTPARRQPPKSGGFDPVSQAQIAPKATGFVPSFAGNLLHSGQARSGRYNLSTSRPPKTARMESLLAGAHLTGAQFSRFMGCENLKECLRLNPQWTEAFWYTLVIENKEAISQS